MNTKEQTPASKKKPTAKKPVARNTNVAAKKQETPSVDSSIVLALSRKDMVYSLLIMSLLVNLFFFVSWVVLQVTSQYDAEVAQILFAR